MDNIYNDFQTIATITLISFVVIVTIAALVKFRVDKVREDRRIALARTYYAHPAGQGLAQRPPLERTRHIDRPGFDWTSDTL